MRRLVREIHYPCGWPRKLPERRLRVGSNGTAVVRLEWPGWQLLGFPAEGDADRIEGPYLDRDGKDMRQGGGSLLLATAGRFIGPGGQEAVKTSKGDMIAYHYYDGDAGGVAKLQFSPLDWTPDAWPQLGAVSQ